MMTDMNPTGDVTFDMMTDMNPTGDVTCNHLVLRGESPSCLFTDIDRNTLILSTLFVAVFLFNGL